ncbi:DNA mismatch repair endonuclease MutL [Candidatus Dojkabacteria bacterium]|nr:DNA mismatch repair endonuclease MutL [Candidatus Dojkabacteria bacterium]
MQIIKLPQELINQIAAGEVIERPASVVKELIDNSIDAQAKNIQIKIQDGGAKLIEVQDNGIGIPKDQLATAFESHTTSKITKIEDLNDLMTMGFRGEALATIQSVSEVTAISKHSDSEFAYKIRFMNADEDSPKPEKTAHQQGTTIRVEDLFDNIPARKKYLKTPATEYRHILKTLTNYFLIHPEIHFTLEKDGKQVFNLPDIKGSLPNSLHTNRVSQVMKNDWAEEMIDFFYDGQGIKVGGLASLPKFHTKKTNHEYIYVNKRPVYDRGIVKSVLQGFSRYIPHGEKVPFLISLTIKPELVDVNVHPRKEEVRFINPYRVYSAVEQAIQKALQREVSLETNGGYSTSDSEKDIGFRRLRTRSSGKPDFLRDGGNAGASYSKTNSGKLRELKFNKRLSTFDVQNSLKFSEKALESMDGAVSEIKSISQIFNKYILVEFESELWVIDQHAAAERITFEHLKSSLSDEVKNTQHLLVPEEIEFSPAEIEFLKESSDFFEKSGFELDFEGQTVKVKSLPADISGADIGKIFREIFDGAEDLGDIDVASEKVQEDIIATMSCHTSIRSGQSLHSDEILSLVKNLIKCSNPYSCPHGRSVVWKLVIEDIDKNFDRTY